MNRSGRKMVFFWLVMIVLLSGCVREEVDVGISPEMEAANLRGFARAQEEMVETQIKDRGIKDERLLQAMLRVERYRFVPEEMQRLAYTGWGCHFRSASPSVLPSLWFPDSSSPV